MVGISALIAYMGGEMPYAQINIYNSFCYHHFYVRIEEKRKGNEQTHSSFTLSSSDYFFERATLSHTFSPHKSVTFI